MAKNSNISWGDHFEGFINEQVMQGRYGSANKVIRASLRLLEEREKKIQALRQALIEGEESGDAGDLDMEAIRLKAKKKSGKAIGDLNSITMLCITKSHHPFLWS